MNTLNEVKAEVKKAESVLKQLVKRGADVEVVEAQKKSVDKVKAKLEVISNTPTEKAIQATATADFVTFNVVKDGEISKESKKIAFVKHNRPIDIKRVDKFIHLIGNKKYEEAYPIIVAEANKLLEYHYAVVDVEGQEIDKVKANEYYVFLDGQHRGMAFAKLIAIGEVYEIPNVYLRDKENLGEYLVDINDAAKSWDSKDKYAVAGLTSKEEAIQTISEKIGEGFNPSTAAIIYLGKKISSKILNQALKGEDIKYPKGTSYNKERGDKFITLCKVAGMEVNLITKHYYIDGFNSYAALTSDDAAFEVLRRIGEIDDFKNKIKKVKDGDDFIKLLKEVA